MSTSDGDGVWCRNAEYPINRLDTGNPTNYPGVRAMNKRRDVRVLAREKVFKRRKNIRGRSIVRRKSEKELLYSLVWNESHVNLGSPLRAHEDSVAGSEAEWRSDFRYDPWREAFRISAWGGVLRSGVCMEAFRSGVLGREFRSGAQGERVESFREEQGCEESRDGECWEMDRERKSW